MCDCSTTDTCRRLARRVVVTDINLVAPDNLVKETYAVIFCLFVVSIDVRHAASTKPAYIVDSKLMATVNVLDNGRQVIRDREPRTVNEM